MQKTATVVPVSGMDASPLSAVDAPLLCSNIGVICQVLVRTTLAKEQVASSRPVEDDQALFTDAIDAMIAILRYDITSALSPVPAPTESPRTTGGAAAAAAANAAAVNAAALASLLPSSVERSVAVISSLGRMIEHSESCKAHAKAQGLLPVLLDCFKAKEADSLHQVADKLLHLCVHVSDVPVVTREYPSQQPHEFSGDAEGQSTQAKASTRIDPQILCAVATGDVEPRPGDTNEADAATPPTHGEKPPLVAVEAVLSLLEASHESTNKALIFRHVRWIAALVDLPENANALGERAVSLFLQLLATTPANDKLLFAFLAKCVHAVVLQNAGALELCGAGGHEPSTLLVEFLQGSSRSAEAAESAAAGDATDSTFLSQEAEESTANVEQPGEGQSETEPVHDACKLEWADEYEEQAAFELNPLTEACHNVDTSHLVAEALAGLASAFLKWNPAASGSVSTDFSELIAAKLDAEHASPGKAAPAGSKKKLAPDQSKPSPVGEAVMLCILEKGVQIPKLVSKYTAVNAAVCVSLLALLDNLVTVPSGMKVLLQLAKSELQAETPVDHADPATTSSGQWPLSVEVASRSEHALLLLPVMNVLQSLDTSFIEVEAAVRSMALMTSDLEPSDRDSPAPAPEPLVEAAKSPTKGGAAAAPPPPAAPSIPELVVSESDRFVNAALACGALVVLLAFTDHARIPREVDEFSKRAGLMKKHIEDMVTRFVTLAQVKQEGIATKYKEKMALLQPPDAEDGAIPEVSADLDLPYQATWAQLLLDHKFNVPRFGYDSYSALLLAAELAHPTLVSTLLGAGASPETESPDGVTPLMIAFLVGNEEMVIDLLDARANIDAITKDGQDLTVWNCALVSPLKARVSSLITQAYTSSESSESSDSKPTMSARIQLDAIEGSLQFLDMCLDAGVDVNVSNAEGDFLLHALLSKCIVRRKLRGLDLCFRYSSYYEDQRRLHQAVVDLIQAHAANVNSCNRMGQTPLHLALLYGYTGIAKILLSRGANPNVQSVYGHLPLHYACLGFCGNLDGSDGQAIEVTRLLLEYAPKYTRTVGVHTDRRKHKTPAEKQALAIETILERGLQSVIEPQSIVHHLATAQQVLTTPSFLGEFLPWHFACGTSVQLAWVLCLDDDMHKWFEANGQARADLLQYLVREWKIDISASDAQN
jgi:ankyrin repeat protein